MALKDWKNMLRVFPAWINTNTGEQIYVMRILPFIHKYKFQSNLSSVHKTFLTKSEALKFAKQYMRAH